MIKIILVAILSVSYLSSSAQDTKNPPLIIKGTPISKHGYIAKNLISILEIYEIQNHGSKPQQWSDISNINGIEIIKEIKEDRGIDITKHYGFTTTQTAIPEFNNGTVALMSLEPMNNERSNASARYVIWRGNDGQYQFINLPESDIQKLIKNYGVAFTSPPSSLNKQVIETDNANSEKAMPASPTLYTPYEHGQENNSPPQSTSNYKFFLTLAIAILVAVLILLYRFFRHLKKSEKSP